MKRGKKIISESNASQLSWYSFKVKRWSHFQLSGESNPGLLSFCSTLFCDWLKKTRVTYSTYQSDSKLKLIATRSLAFSRALIFFFVFSSRRLLVIFPSYVWLFWSLWFLIGNPWLKRALLEFQWSLVLYVLLNQAQILCPLLLLFVIQVVTFSCWAWARLWFPFYPLRMLISHMKMF